MSDERTDGQFRCPVYCCCSCFGYVPQEGDFKHGQMEIQTGRAVLPFLTQAQRQVTARLSGQTVLPHTDNQIRIFRSSW